MAHPTRTGDLVVFSSPPYQFDAATPGTLIALSAFFGQHGYVPDVQDLDSNTNMRATFLAGGDAIDRGTVDDVRSIDLAPTAAFLLGIPVPQHSQGVVRLDLLDDGDRYRPLSIIGLNDFHGQLDQTTSTIDGRTVTVGGAGQLATMFDEEAASLPGETLLLAAGDNVGASPPNSGLLDDMPAIDVENAWGLDATSLGNHEFDFGVERLQAHQDRADFPFLATNVVDETTGEAPDWLDGTSEVFRRQRHPGRCPRRGGQDDSRARQCRCHRGPAVPRRGRAAPARVGATAPPGRQGADRGDPRRSRARAQPRRRSAGRGVAGPDHRDRRGAAGHHDRSRHRRAHPPGGQHHRRRHPGRRGLQRRRQLLGGPADGQGIGRRVGRDDEPHGQEPRRGPARRRAGDRRRGQ